MKFFIDTGNLKEIEALSLMPPTPVRDGEIAGLHRRVDQIRAELYRRLTPWQRVLVARHPDIAAIVLECTNMPPYADAVRAATGLPVHDITTLVRDRFAAATTVRVAP